MESDPYTRQLYANPPEILLDENVTQASQTIFGRVLEDFEWGALVGAVSGATVTVQGYGNSVYIEVEHPQYEQARSVFGSIQGIITMDNEHFKRLDLSDPHRPKGLGTRVIARQVQTARKLGLSEITTVASGYYGGSNNGYYTWPRLGFEGALTEDMRTAFAIHTGGEAPQTILELLALEGGKEWWLHNGSTIGVAFDLTRGSASDVAMLNYLKEMGIWSG